MTLKITQKHPSDELLIKGMERFRQMCSNKDRKIGNLEDMLIIEPETEGGKTVVIALLQLDGFDSQLFLVYHWVAEDKIQKLLSFSISEDWLTARGVYEAFEQDYQ